MVRVAFMAAFLSGACQAAELPDAFLGTWTPIEHTSVQAILGPAGVKTFTMAKDRLNGDYWMSYIAGQVFRVRDNLMQYCFAHVATSPFVVDTVEDNLIRFCYPTGDRMPTHKALANGSLATGCDAAKIELALHDNGNLEFSFWMSPPIRHAWAVYKRIGPAPPVASYIAMGGTCDPLHPGRPTLGGQLDASMCSSLNHKRQQLELAMPTTEHIEVQEDGEEEGSEGKRVACRRYDSGVLSYGSRSADKVDIRLQYTVPTLRCWPCKVSYSVSAAIAEDEYIALGFKGMAYRGLANHRKVSRPNYFGMSTDEVDEERTTRAMVLGYAGAQGGCVREMKAENYVGEPADVQGNPHLMDESVERLNGRTIIRFTIEQHVGRDVLEIHNFFNGRMTGTSARTMWAIGGLEGDGCDAKIQFHRARGLSPLAWFNENPKHFCIADEAELGVHMEGDEVSV